MTYQIIKGVGVPARVKGDSKYPFPRMDVDDGFDAPLTERCRISNYSWLWGKRQTPPVKFTVRKIDENTVRCVRIA